MIIFLISHWKHMMWPLIWTVSMRRLRRRVTTYVFMQNQQKFSLIIIKYSLSRALLRVKLKHENCPLPQTDWCHMKWHLIACVNSKHSDQPAHPYNLIRTLPFHINSWKSTKNGKVKTLVSMHKCAGWFTLKCLSIGTPKTINFLFVPNGKLMDFRCPNYLSTS